MPSRPRQLPVAVAALLAALSAGRAAAAEPSAAEKETSRDLYAQGIQALAAADYLKAERACRTAYELVVAPTGALCWARALEGLGKLVEARDAYLSAAHYPARPDEPPVFTSARDDARKAADAIEAKIPTLLLLVSGPPQDAPLHASLDGHPLNADAVRLPLKTNPGPHRLDVGAAGFADQSMQVTLSVGEQRRIGVRLRPALMATVAHASHPSRLPLYAAWGAGGAGLLVGSIAGLLAFSSASTAKSFCSSDTNCSPGAQPNIDAAKRWATVSDVGFVVGGLGAALGVTLLLVSEPSRAAGQDRTVSLVLGPEGIALRGAMP